MQELWSQTSNEKEEIEDNMHAKQRDSFRKLRRLCKTLLQTRYMTETWRAHEYCVKFSESYRDGKQNDY